MNPLFNAIGGGQLPGTMGQFQNMIQRFRQFQNSFQGDPKAEVEKLVQSGKISQPREKQAVSFSRTFQEDTRQTYREH